MKDRVFRVAVSITLAATLLAIGHSILLQADREAEWQARFESLREELRSMRLADSGDLGRSLSSPATAITEPDSLPRLVSDNRKDLDLLRGEIRELKSLIAQRDLRADDRWAEPYASPLPREDFAREREVARETRKVDAVTEFRAQAVNPEWAERMASGISDISLHEAAKGISIPEVECRSSSCEVHWALDEGLSQLERFERDNQILVELAKMGLSSVVYLDAEHPGEFRAIFSTPPER